MCKTILLDQILLFLLCRKTPAEILNTESVVMQQVRLPSTLIVRGFLGDIRKRPDERVLPFLHSDILENGELPVLHRVRFQG